MERAVVLSHFDLDAAGAVIVAHHLYDVTRYCVGGYPKVDANLEKLYNTAQEKNIGLLVVGDLRLTPEQMEWAVTHFDEVHYYDHHDGSAQFVEMAKDVENLRVWYDADYCATTIMMREFIARHGIKSVDPAMKHFTFIVDTYDMWRLKTPAFQESKILNELFWEKGLFDFVSDFIDGYNVLSDKDRKQGEAIIKQRIDSIASAYAERIDDDHTIILLEDAGARNEVQFVADGRIFYILSWHEGENKYTGSIRIKEDDDLVEADANEAVLQVCEVSDTFISGGGHKKAAGMIFRDGASSEEIFEAIEDELIPILKATYLKDE